ncbi:MAG: glycoside hydrolase [Ferruginibacter sp.]
MKKHIAIHWKFITLLPAFCIILQCRKGQASNDNPVNPVVEKPIQVMIDATRAYQTIENFGASDAWSCQFVGNWPAAKKDKIAELLFSTDTTANGNPKGIGLSLWRFNIGAGSTEQQDVSGIKDEWRRAPSFLQQDGKYNWNSHAGQQWFLQAAQQRGVKEFLGFFNSPPVQYTINAKAYATAGRCNLDNTRYRVFADFTKDMIQGIKNKTGILFNYISPFNEPQWDWSDGGQEGNPYSNKEIAAITKTLDSSFSSNQIQTKIVVPEAGHIKYLLADEDKFGKGNQVDAFFNASSAEYIGNLSHVKHAVAYHSYFSTSPIATAIDTRQKVAARIASIKDLSLWQSEYCILGDNEGEIKGEGRDLGMTAALYIARTIHTDLTISNATAWQWWLAISPYDYKDGLIYIDKDKTDGNFYESKMLWALGNFSRFIRPGMQRIAVETVGNETGNYFISAYKNEQTKKLVIVLINPTVSQQSFEFKTPSQKLLNKRGALDIFTTNQTKSLEKSIMYSNVISISPKSITTLVIENE